MNSKKCTSCNWSWVPWHFRLTPILSTVCKQRVSNVQRAGSDGRKEEVVAGVDERLGAVDHLEPLYD